MSIFTDLEAQIDGYTLEMGIKPRRLVVSPAASKAFRKCWTEASSIMRTGEEDKVLFLDIAGLPVLYYDPRQGSFFNDECLCDYKDGQLLVSWGDLESRR